MAEKKVFEILKERGFIYQSTNLEQVEKLVNGEKPITFYLGIDPTADSLHIGHFFALRMFRHLQEAGHKGILVIGGATALVGDPSGKSNMRQMLTKEQVAKNVNEVKEIAKRFIITEGENAAKIYDNSSWMRPYDYIDFLRDVGIHFNVNTMLTADLYANRIKEGGLTFLEMGYMLMQAYDFAHLKDVENCVLQIGGSDQWGNIVAGTRLNRKMHNIGDDEANNSEDIYGLTCPLLLTKDGKKMGKTEKGTLWIAREKTAPFDFYQYFYNIEDESTDLILKVFTDVDVKTIDDLCKNDIIKAKKLMAYEVTKLVHGKEEADKVVEAVNSLFGKGDDNANVPSIEIEESFIGEGVSLVDLVVYTKLLPSKSETRRMIEQNAISLNDKKITVVDYVVTKNDFAQGYAMLQKGKKTFLKVILK